MRKIVDVDNKIYSQFVANCKIEGLKVGDALNKLMKTSSQKK